jgi:hypothetical protein
MVDLKSHLINPNEYTIIILDRYLVPAMRVYNLE